MSRGLFSGGSLGALTQANGAAVLGIVLLERPYDYDYVLKSMPN